MSRIWGTCQVFLCHYAQDRKTLQIIRWGEKDESGNVIVDRNRMIQLVIDEVRQKRFRLYNGSEIDWNDYWLHWSHIYRTKEEDELGMEKYTWKRSDRDDWVHATVYWRVGIDRFGNTGAIFLPTEEVLSNGYIVNPNNTVSFNPDKMFANAKENVDEVWWANEDGDEDDWRNN